MGAGTWLASVIYTHSLQTREKRYINSNRGSNIQLPSANKQCSSCIILQWGNLTNSVQASSADRGLSCPDVRLPRFQQSSFTIFRFWRNLKSLWWSVILEISSRSSCLWSPQRTNLRNELVFRTPIPSTGERDVQYTPKELGHMDAKKTEARKEFKSEPFVRPQQFIWDKAGSRSQPHHFKSSIHCATLSTILAN